MTICLAHAQVKVELVSKGSVFLPNETMKIGVKITNFSGQTIEFGKSPDWVKFSVTDTRGRVVSTVGTVPVEGLFSIKNSEYAIRWIDLAPHFMMEKTGNYEIFATVKLEQWNEEYFPDKIGVDILPGATIWSQLFGVPSNKTEVPEIRKYVLQKSTRRDRIYLYFRLTNKNESQSYTVYPIGNMVSFGEPENQIDHQGYLHVLHQFGAKTFWHHKINQEGKLVERRVYSYNGSRPRLKPRKDGTIAVMGGKRVKTKHDIPEEPKVSDKSQEHQSPFKQND